jgi:hypothetical protein
MAVHQESQRYHGFRKTLRTKRELFAAALAPGLSLSPRSGNSKEMYGGKKGASVAELGGERLSLSAAFW